MHNSNADYVLTSIPVVLERILGYLPIVDLHRVRSVCKAWRMSAQNVIQIKEEYPHAEVLSIFQETGEGSFVKFKRPNKEMTWNKESDKYCDLKRWKNNWKHQPTDTVCVCLATGKRRKYANLEAENLLRYWLPPASKLLVLGTVDSAVCVDREQSSKENDVADAERFYNVLCIPQKPGSYSVSFLSLKVDHTEEDHEQFFSSAREELTHPDTKMVLVCERLFQYQRFHEFHKDTLNPAIRRGVVVIGCLFESPIVFSPDGSPANKDDSYQEIVAMLLKGRNVRSASVIVGPEIETIHGLQAELQKLRMTVSGFSKDCPDKCKNRSRTGYCDSCMSQTIGLMIACCARADSSEWYDVEDTDAPSLDRNEEQEAFRNMLPNVPIFGAFGMGEIGATINIACDHETIGPADDLYRRESTVFAVVVLK